MINEINFVGLVVGKREFDKGCFLDILTDTHGVIEAVALGGKSGKNTAGFSLFSYSDFAATENDHKITVKSASPKYVFWGLTQDFEALALACYFAEIVKFSGTAYEPAAAMLRFVLITLYETEKRYNLNIKPVFETRVTAFLGFAPDLVSCKNCGDVVPTQAARVMFDLEHGGLICDRCRDRCGDAPYYFPIDNAALDSLRNALFGNVERIYKNAACTGLKRGVTDVNAAFAAVSEKYVAYHLDKHFKSLSYFKSAKLF